MPTHLFQVAREDAKADAKAGRRAGSGVAETRVFLDPVFFTGPDGTFRIHKAKLAYLVAAAEEFASETGAGVVYPDDVDAEYARLGSGGGGGRPLGFCPFDPMDRFVSRRLREAGIPVGSGRSAFPGFVLDPRAYPGAARLNPVYAAAREATGLLPGWSGSLDSENRERPDPGFAAWSRRPGRPPRRSPTRAMRLAAAWVESRYPDHPGDALACGYYPATRRAALARLRAYARSGVSRMRYQDAIVAGESFLAHSVLSAAMNVGLLGPAEVAAAVLASRAGSESDKEGFARQVLGWRELVAVVAVRRESGSLAPPAPARFPASSAPPAPWYEGTTGLDPVDDCVRRALATGYLHHIERLMVVLNAMVLSGLGEAAVHRWFSKDSPQRPCGKHSDDTGFHCNFIF
jgi:hypothetical protein